MEPAQSTFNGIHPDWVAETVPFTSGDGFGCNLIHIRKREAPIKGPVLLVHGAGVRAQIFAAPVETHLVRYLVERGWDVWLENWRTSIDLPFNHWTLDQAALYDHPHAVKKVCEQTGAEAVDAIVHCQGSTSFMMSLVSGLMPQVRRVISNAVSLHPVVPAFSAFKLNFAVPAVSPFTDHLNPQWGISRSGFLPNLLNILVRLSHHECDNAVCKHASFIYGTGWPTLWKHENLNTETHEWMKREFAKVPLSFFRQMAQCVNAGYLVSTGIHPELPRDFTGQSPKTGARITLVTGLDNRCFLPESQRRTQAWLRKHGSDCRLIEFPNYGHLDIFMGKNSARNIFPVFEQELLK